jgi:hypothetical protein
MPMGEFGNRLFGVRFLGPLLAGLLAAGCVIAPPPGTPPPPAVDVLTGDARASRYGSNAAEMLAHPEARESVRRLFGSDQNQAMAARLSRSAADFFGNPSPTRVLRIAGADYLAATGCVPSACSTHPGLLLIRVDGKELFARLDDGGFSHYYGFGTGVEMTPTTLALLDAAWRALRP